MPSPTWMRKNRLRIDFGKDKFGGPFTEEEVEDVKTVLRLLPLLICCKLCCRYCQYVSHKPIDRP